MLKGFRDFLLRGNVVDLAVAVIIGAAFSAITTSLVADVITPLLSAFVGKPNFDYLNVNIHGGVVQYGKFLTALISFLMLAAVVYFFIVTPMQAMLNRFAPTLFVARKPCPQCLGDIPLAASRCKFCAQPVELPAHVTSPVKV